MMTDLVKAHVRVNHHWRAEPFINLSFTCDMLLPMCEFDISFKTTTLFTTVRNECIKRSPIDNDEEKNCWHGEIYELERTGFCSITIWIRILSGASLPMAAFLMHRTHHCFHSHQRRCQDQLYVTLMDILVMTKCMIINVIIDWQNGKMY